MIWYTLEQHNEEWIVFKNIHNHGIACRGIFKGTKNECEKYCEANNIKLGIKNKK